MNITLYTVTRIIDSKQMIYQHLCSFATEELALDFINSEGLDKNAVLIERKLVEVNGPNSLGKDRMSKFDDVVAHGEDIIKAIVDAANFNGWDKPKRDVVFNAASMLAIGAAIMRDNGRTEESATSIVSLAFEVTRKTADKLFSNQSVTFN